MLHEYIGFCSFEAAYTFFEASFQEEAEQDASGLTTMSRVEKIKDGRSGLGYKINHFHQYLCALWKFKAKQVTGSTLRAWFGINPKTISRYLRRWCHWLGEAGRSLVWLPSSQYLRDTQPQMMKDNGMPNAVLAGDCTEVVTETVRKHIHIRNQQHANKSHHIRNQQHANKSHASAAIGCSFTTARGGNAVALDLALGRASEDQLTQIIAQYLQLDPDLELMYDKGCPHLRAYLPNFNNGLVPCFLRPSQVENHDQTNISVT